MLSGAWRMASASSIGTSHVASGLPCQDSAEQAIFDTQAGSVLTLVVCDGAGSAAHSDIGSSLAARTFVELVGMHFEAGRSLSEINRPTAAGWLEQIVQALETHAGAFDRSLRDYACTLLAAIIGDESAVFLQVGDGAIVVSHGPEDGWAYVFWPQHGEFANTTNFVVSANMADILDFEFAPRRIDEVAIFSDGIENLVLHHATKTVFEPFFNRVLEPVRRSIATGLDAALSEGLCRYLATPQFTDRTDDDKTLVLATRVVVSDSVQG